MAVRALGPGMQAIAAPVPSPRALRGPGALLQRVPGARGERLDDARGDVRPSLRLDGGRLAVGVQRAARPLSRVTSTAQRRVALSARSAARSARRRAALEALRRAEVDVIALDSYWLDLLPPPRALELEGVSLRSRRRAWTPIPLLVAAEHVPVRVVERLRSALTQLHESPANSALLADVLVERFVMPDVGSYAALAIITE